MRAGCPVSSPREIATQRALQRLGAPGPDAVLGQSVLPVLGDNPDEVAAARDLSKRSGLPLPVVEADRSRAEREAKLRELNLPGLAQRSPATAAVLKDREVARVAHDDVRNMGLIERYVRDIGQRFERGQRINELGPLGSDALLEALTGGQTDESREFRIRQLQGQQAAETDFGVDPGGVLGFFAGIPGAVAEALPMMGSGVVASAEGGAVGAAGGAAAGAAIGTLAGPGGAAAGAVAGAGEGYATGASLGLYIHSAKMEAGHSFLELRGITDENGQPIDQRVAAGLSLAVGATAGAVEMFALGKLLEKVPGVDRLTGAGWRAAAKKAVSNPSFRQFATGLAFSASGSAATEGLTEGVQELIAISGELAGLTVTGKGLDDFRFEAPGPDGQPIELRGTDAILARVLSATSQGAQMGAGVAASGHTARLVTDSERARATIARLPGLERLQRTVDASKLRERDPEAFRRHVREVAAQSGVEAVYVEPQAFREYFESIAPEEAQALFDEIPALREQQEEIGRTGADVRLRLEDFLGHPEMAEALREHVRFDPLEMTAKEALGFQDELEREVGTVQEVVEGARDEGSARQAVAGEIRAQLLKVYPDTVVAPLVELTMARMETRAQRAGKTLQQLVEEEGVFRIQGPQEGAPEARGQLPPTLESRLARLQDEGAVRQVLGDLRAGRTPETKGMSQRPILELLRDLGGVDPEGELGVQLRELGIRPRGKGAIKGLFVKGGRGTADNIVASEFPLLQELADQATGYVDPRLLERALSNEVAGTPLRTQEEGAAIAEAEQMRAAVREAIEAAGLTLEADDEALVTAVLDAATAPTQEFREANRGAIRMTDDLADVVIRFTEAADLSTFLHESGHLYLAQLAKDAATDEGQLEADLETVKDWARERVGTDDVNSDAVQELWARSFEAYLFEGKAPTLALERVFARFSAWLIRIYKRLRGIPGYENSLTPEIRGVMDRLLATDEQIAEAAEARGLQEMDASALGMTEAQAAEYHRAVSDAKDEAKRRLLPQLMEQARLQATKEWKDLRESVRAEVEADVNSRPVFQVQHWLRNGKPLEGAPTPIVPHAKLDREALVELYGKEITKVLPGLYQKEGGLHPDVVAEIFGFPNGDDMVRSLAAAGRRQDVIAQETEAETLRRHGKPETRDDVEAKALEALANQKQLKALLLAERAAATKAGGKVIPLNVAKASAERIVRATRYRDLQPHRFRAAALKAGREAVKLIAKGDYPEAQRAIRLQINNLLMESEARRAIAEVDRGLDYLHRVQSPRSWERIGKAGADYQEQIEGLLSRFNLRRNQSLRRIDKLHGLASWIADQEARGETVLVPPKLRDEAFRTSWKELSIEDMLALRDSVRNLEHMARRKNEFLANRDRRQREAVQADLVAAVDANGKPSNPRLSLTPTEIETWKSWLHTAEGALVKMEFLIDLLDGGDPQGQWRRNVFTPIAEAQAERLDLSKEYTEKLARSMDTLLKGKSKAYTAQWYEPTLGVRMNKMNLLALALNVGNEGNLHRLTDAKGNGWSEQAIMSVLDQRMTESDWAFVRETWTLIDSLWPRIAEQERRLTGVVPEKVQGRTVRTRFGEFEGGYFPVVYDPHRSQFAYKIADKGLYEGLENHFQRAITGHGHTIERTNVAGPLLLDLAVIPSHLDQVIHDLTHREVLMQVDKLLQSEQIRAAFKRTNFGDEWFQLFRPWLQGIAKDRIVENRALQGFSRLLAATRSATTTFTLGFRATTLLMQTTGHSNAVGILRERLPNWRQHYVSGMRKALGGLSPKQMHATYEGVLEASGEMRHRISNLDRDLRDVIRRNQGKVTGPARARRAAMELIGKMQMFGVDLPVWLASYEGAQAELGYTHEQAVEFADSVVRMSQGAAGAKDLSAIQRADEGYKQFTLFYSYMNTVYNQVALFSGRRVKSIRDVPAFLASYGYFILLPALGAALIRDALGSNALPEEDADEGDWFAWFVGLGLSELASMVPFVRDVLPPLIRQVTDGGRYFSGETPVQRAGEAVSDLVVPKDAIDFMFDMARIGSLAAGLPADDVLKRAEKAIRGEE